MDTRTLRLAARVVVEEMRVAGGNIEEAIKLLERSDELIKTLENKVGVVEKEIQRAKDQQKGLEKAGAGATEAHTLLKGVIPPLKDLQDFVNNVITQVQRLNA